MKYPLYFYCSFIFKRDFILSFLSLFCLILLGFPILFLISFYLFDYNIFNIVYLPLAIFISDHEYYFPYIVDIRNNFLSWFINLLTLPIFIKLIEKRLEYLETKNKESLKEETKNSLELKEENNEITPPIPNAPPLDLL
jgi:hypothetical protein